MTIALDNVVAVVTGAAGGIGRELVKALKAAHATVIATDMAADFALGAEIEGADRYVEMGAAPSREVAQAAMEARHPIGRQARPAEMGGGVVYLCSEAASFVTCSELVIDGGFSQV